MLDDIFDYLEHIRERPVWQPIPDAVRARMRAELPTAPTDLATVHDEFMHTVLPYTTGNIHPGFMGWVHGGGNPVGMLAEMLAAGLNANLGGRDHMPIEVERQITAWVRQIVGFPDTASGLFVTGTSMANLIGVLVARTAALGVQVRRNGIAATGAGLTAYVSVAAHGCISQAMDLSGIGSEQLRLIPTNQDHEIDVHALERAIAADREAGFRPFLIVGNAGTVDIGAIDDLAALADTAAREQLWFHIDGALGALGMLAPSLAPLLAGIERADSIALDFHKWAQVPYDAGFILVRDGAVHQSTFASPAAYLRREMHGLAAGSPWPCDFGPDLSRGFRALKTWFTLKTYGTTALGAVIEQTCSLARDLASRIAATPELELLAPVRLNIVCFRYRIADPNRVNQKIVADLQISGIAAPSTTMLGGDLAIRAAIVNHRTQPEDIDALVAAVLRFGRAERNRAAANGQKEVSMNTTVPTLDRNFGADLPNPIGLPTLAKLAFDGADLVPIWNLLATRARENPDDAAALLDLSTIAHLQGRPDDRLALQGMALGVCPFYRKPVTVASMASPIRLLVFMAPGDFLANIPIEFLLEDSNVTLIMVYVQPGRPLPNVLPDHDVAMVAIAESHPNQALLRELGSALRSWPRPVVNAPGRIASLTRDGTWELLKSAPGVMIPINARVDRPTLERIQDGGRIDDVLAGLTFPIIARPLDSHAGEGLEKLDDAAAIGGYLQRRREQTFYLAPFVDYRGTDGLFRKYRIVLIAGRPYASHMAISTHWMIHYLNADMMGRAERRMEEARFMADFDQDFASRHAEALDAIAQRAGLDYLPFDCGETRDGRLLIFETGTNMIVHAMDSPELFPYKQLQMRKVFAAFEAMLREARGRDQGCRGRLSAAA